LRFFQGTLSQQRTRNDVQNTRTANLNFWNGGQFDTNFVTGSSSGWSYFNVEFEPEIKVNQAIRMRGFYQLGTWGDPAATDYITQDAPGSKNAFSEGQWTQFWLTVNTPWGVFGVGKRPWKFGIGLQYDGSDAATCPTSITFVYLLNHFSCLVEVLCFLLPSPP
jgi:hypothetical protein